MAATSMQPNPMQWTGDHYDREALWTKEPDIVIIKSLALWHLAPVLPESLDIQSLEVQDFAQGGFNKQYSISFTGHPTYLLRVALPLVPHYKIESEAAVLSFVKKNTSIPVPRVIAWDSSTANELGFGWILVGKLEGVALQVVWRRMPWESKSKLVAALASLLAQLHDHKFGRIGSLFFAGREIQPSADSCQACWMGPGSGLHAYDSQAKISTNGVTSPAAGHSLEQSRYVLGQLLNPLVYLDRRLYLPGNRGPYRTSREWLAAEIDFQMTWIETCPVIKGSGNCEQNAQKLKQLCHDYHGLLLELFPTTADDPPNVLYHHD